MLPPSFLRASLGRDKSITLTKVTYSYYFWYSQEEEVSVIHFLASANQLQILGSDLEYDLKIYLRIYLKNILENY